MINARIFSRTPHLMSFVTQGLRLSTLIFLWGCTNAVPQLDLFLAGISTEKANPVAFASPPESTISYEGLIITGTCTNGKSVLVGGSGMSGAPILAGCSSGVFSQTIIFSSGDGVKTIELAESDSPEIKISRNFIRETPPLEVTVNQSLIQADPTSNPSISFDIRFSRAIDPLTFDAADIINTGSSTVGSWILTDSGDHKVFNLVSTSIANSGTLGPTIPAGVVDDFNGFPNKASTSTDNSVTYLIPAGTSVPLVLSVSSPSINGTYTNGQTLTIELNYSEPVYVTGGPAVPSILMATGATPQSATYVSGSGTTTLSFSYPITATDYSPDLEVSSSAINLNGSSIKSAATVDASLLIPLGFGGSSLSTNKNLVVIGTPANLVVTSAGSFGIVSVGTSQSVVFTISNSASSLVPASFLGGSISGPFSFEGGGAFPGPSSTCTTDLPPGGSCTFLGVFQPSTEGLQNGTFTLNYNNGIASTFVNQGLTGTGALIPLVVDPVYPSFGANWNDYVQFTQQLNGPRGQGPSASACLGSETGYANEFGGCIHGGELKKVSVTGQGSCVGLSLIEHLGVFQWDCTIETSVATFYTKGFAPGKGLRDLITGGGGTGSWKTNYVTVKSGGTPIAASSPQAWWTNPVMEAPTTDPTSNAIQSLSTLGTVYYASTDRQYQILDITADKIALVTLGSAKIGANNYSGGGVGRCNPSNGSTLSGTILALICIDNIKHLWLEASLTGDGVTWIGNAGLMAYGLKHSRIHRTTMNGFHSSVAQSILSLSASNSNLITEAELFKGSQGLSLANGSGKNTFRNLSISSIMGSSSAWGMLKIVSSSDANRFYDLSLSNLENSTSSNAHGINVLTDGNIFQRVNISNVNGTLGNGAGIKLTGGGNIFVQVGAFGSRNTGIWLAGGANNDIFSHYTATNHMYNGIYVSSSSNSNNYFQSVAIVNVGNKAVEVIDSSGTGNVFNSILASDSTYSFDIASPSWGAWEPLGYLAKTSAMSCLGSIFCSSIPNLQTISAPNLSNAFVGRLGGITGDDSKNSLEHPSTGQASFSALFSAPQQWFTFEHWLRGWGLAYSAAFPAVPHQGYCGAGNNCQAWDWRVRTGNELHNKSGNGFSGNNTFTAGATCPSEVDGGSGATTRAAKTFLHNAIEIDGDSVGNDNGLCESNEACVYAPNIGAYQGESAYTEPCSFVDGSVLGVTMKSYSITGK